MTSYTRPKYKFQNAELGVMSEIMLPKKIQYQGFLFDALLKGITEFEFKKAYNEQEKERIDELLTEYTSLTDKLKDKNTIENFEIEFRNIFKGYSMYEVDGVFRYEDKNNINYVEERTQIIKVFYIPEYDKIRDGFNKKFKEKVEIQTIINFADLFFANSKVTSYETGNLNINRRLSPFLTNTDQLEALGFTLNKHKEKTKYLTDYFTNWVDAVAFFTFGYIVGTITKKLNENFEKELVKYLGKNLTDLNDNELKIINQKKSELEDEIWVTSQWGVLINKTILTN